MSDLRLFIHGMLHTTTGKVGVAFWILAGIMYIIDIKKGKAWGAFGTLSFIIGWAILIFPVARENF